MSFLEEFRELHLSSPRIALQMSDSFNSDYTNYAFKNENCYLVFGSHYNEYCYYLQYCYSDKDCVDSDYTDKSTLAYECTFCANIYDCDYLFNCFTCSDCEFGFDLVNCQNCFLCANLRNSSYRIRNKQVPKEKYHEEIASLKLKYSQEELLEEYFNFKLAISS